MIEAKQLSRAYDDGAKGRLSVLDQVSFSVAAGEFVAIVGRSGSGKSTLLHVLGGLDTGFLGELTVAGTRLDRLGDAALSRYRNETVGFVFQSFHLMSGVSALENVLLPSRFSAQEVSGLEAKAHAALERVGLTAAHGRRAPGQLSGGERQRVAIARALFGSPKVLLCDEPTGNLDAATADEVVALFKTLNQAGLTVVAVTHEDRLRAAASRVLTLSGGKLS